MRLIRESKSIDPQITICIVHYNKLDRLRNAVSALEQNTDQSYLLKILNNGYENDEILSYLTDLEGKNILKSLIVMKILESHQAEKTSKRYIHLMQ